MDAIVYEIGLWRAGNNKLIIRRSKIDNLM